MLKRCEDTNLSLNWEKSHFMVKEGIVLGHKISKSGLEVDRAKVEVIAKLPHPTSVKGFLRILKTLVACSIPQEFHIPQLQLPIFTISGRRWLLTHDMELAITKCLHSPEYLSALGAAIGKAIEKGMQDGLSAGITHGTEGRALTDVAAYNPSAEADYISALQHLQNVNFSLLAELRSNKDASVDTLMNILHLEETLTERLGLAESQPHVDQLMVPIHHSSDKVVVGATALSLSLDVSNIRVWKIRENIASQRSALRDIFVPLSEPFSTKIIGKILANRLSLVIDDIISKEQSAFMKGMQIMDGHIILNEVIAWYKSKKEQSLLFKVDFQKAFNSVRWDHLDDILGKFGFGNKWRGWIQGCLLSSKAPVLVNRSPTDEFTFHRGLSGGRLTLIKSVLGDIPTYYMSLFKAPEGVLKHLERIHNSFFLGADLDERKITWVSWRKVMAQKQHGGLGVNSLYTLNLALIFKWIWRFKFAHSGLWLNVIKVIYGNEG
ncbi:putative gypsy type transposase [Tanacetum coccineum]